MKQLYFSTPTTLAHAVIQRILEKMQQINGEDFYLALSGGSTPLLLFDIWHSFYSEQTDWDHLKIFWVDERCVPPTDARSNFGATKERLLSKVPIPAANYFRMRGEEVPAKEAERYAQLVDQLLPKANQLPSFHLVLLGIGEDGHTASLFPNQLQLVSSSKYCVNSVQPSSGQERITLTGSCLLNAAELFFLIAGKSKKDILVKVLQPSCLLPAATLLHRGKKVTLFCDEEVKQ